MVNLLVQEVLNSRLRGVNYVKLISSCSTVAKQTCYRNRLAKFTSSNPHQLCDPDQALNFSVPQFSLQ